MIDQVGRVEPPERRPEEIIAYRRARKPAADDERTAWPERRRGSSRSGKDREPPEPSTEGDHAQAAGDERDDDRRKGRFLDIRS